MKDRIKFVVIIICLSLCVGLLPLILIPLPYTGLDWLSYGPVFAQGGYGTGTQPEKVPPQQPPDQVEPGQGKQSAFDPLTPDLQIDFPPGSVSVPIFVRAYYTGLPANVPPPTDKLVGSPFFFGAWVRGQNYTVDRFNSSIVLNVVYNESAISQLPGQQSGRSSANQLPSPVDFLFDWPLALVAYPAAAIFSPPGIPFGHSSSIPLAQEEKLRLNVYDPTTQSWVKLCSRTDSYANVVSGALILPQPLEEGGNSLFAVTFDSTPPLSQSVDSQGNTSLSLPDSNFRFIILPGTVEVGTYFEVTRLANAVNSSSLRLLPTPVDIKGCQADYAMPRAVRQIDQFPKPVRLEFAYDSTTLSRAGGKANLTITTLQNRQWVDLGEFGARIVPTDTEIGVDSAGLGSFSIAVR